jgi:hypothetical protein
VERRQEVAAELVLVVLERLGLDLAGTHVEPAACPHVEGRVKVLERQFLGRLAVDAGLYLGDDAPALGFGEDGRPPFAGEAQASATTRTNAAVASDRELRGHATASAAGGASTSGG